MGITIRSVVDDDRQWIEKIMVDHWGSAKVVTRGRIHDALNCNGFVAEVDDEKVGLITYAIYGKECEVVTMNALKKGMGIGTALLSKVKEEAMEKQCRGIWLITTNDNTDAMRFYQKKGFYFVAVHKDAIKASRRLKPEIPLIGEHGIPIRDEIELVMPL